MRALLFGMMLAISAAGAASAADYVVVATTDTSFHTGEALSAGEKVALGAGKSLTLMHASGDVSVLRGAAGGALVPTRRTASADSARLETLKALVGPAPTGRTFGGKRAGVCPEASTLKTLDDIVQVQAGGCNAEARAALQAYLAKAQ